MYRTCIYCHQSLGSNEAIEHFPVGRRLAFDAGRGRLWVVCRQCERWNLSPLETRWEAIEECERAFRETTMRVSTDNIALARLAEGLELVRVGTPERPEFAAWRYGDQFGRRRRRAILIGGGAAVALVAVAAGAAAAGIGIGSMGGIFGDMPRLMLASRKVKVRTDDGRLLTIRGTEFTRAQMTSPADGMPQLSVKVKKRIEHFEGDEALRLAGRLLPAINVSGGSKGVVQTAVRALESARGSEAFLARQLRGIPNDRKGRPKAIASLDAPTRLALEMALHEEAERRAILGELKVLEAAWQEAEVIAGIADNLFLPESVDAKLAALKARSEAGGPATRDSMSPSD